jgi:hypothetical protein
MNGLRNKCPVFSFAVCFMLITASWGHARAEMVEIVSRGNVAIAPGTTIELRSVEDRPEYRDIAPALKEFLADKALKTSPRGELILRYGFQITGIISSLKDPNFAIAGRTGTGGSSNMQMTMRFRRESQSKSNNKLIMTFELYRPGEPPLWSARILGANRRSNQSQILTEMSRLAIKHIGKTISDNINIDY